jgi:hypothetical protein
MKQSSDILCPSARCEADSILLGVVQATGSVSISPKKIHINSDFVHIAKLGRKPEKRFRFANDCVRNSCKHWGYGRCGVIDKVIEILKPESNLNQVLPCPIRSECRWYKQCGYKACLVCPEVITDLS